MQQFQRDIDDLGFFCHQLRRQLLRTGDRYRQGRCALVRGFRQSGQFGGGAFTAQGRGNTNSSQLLQCLAAQAVERACTQHQAIVQRHRYLVTAIGCAACFLQALGNFFRCQGAVSRRLGDSTRHRYCMFSVTDRQLCRRVSAKCRRHSDLYRAAILFFIERPCPCKQFFRLGGVFRPRAEHLWAFFAQIVTLGKTAAGKSLLQGGTLLRRRATALI